MRLSGVYAEPTLLINFISVIVALKPFHMALAFESENVGRNAIQEPPIM